MQTDLWGKFTVLSEAECRRLHDGALEILRDAGVRLPNDRLLKVMDSAGAAVDWSARVVRLPAKVVEDALEGKRADFQKREPLPARQPGERVKGSFSGFTVRILDMETRAIRLATFRDMIDSIRIANTLDCVDACAHLILPGDVPDGMQDIYQFYGAALASRKPMTNRILNAASVKPILEMNLVIHGSEEALRKSGLYRYLAYCSSPLAYPEDALEMALAVHDLGYPVGFGGTMVTAGASGPVTLAGTLALSNAEALAGIAIARALGHEGHYGAAPIVMDQRSASGCYADPRKLVLCAASRDLTRFYGFPEPAFHIGLDAHQPGIQAGVERTFVSMLGLFLYDCPLSVRLGIMGPAGSVCSLPQIFIDLELVDMLNQFLRGVDVSDETLALDLIKERGIGGTFLDSDHTGAHFREEMWFPKLFERRLPSGAGPVEPERVVERAIQMVRDTLATPQPPPLSAAQAVEIERILKAAGGESRRLP